MPVTRQSPHLCVIKPNEIHHTSCTTLNAHSMKTPSIHRASNNLLGSFLLLSLLSSILVSINLVAYSDLYTAFEGQWQNFTDWMSAFMAYPCPIR